MRYWLSLLVAGCGTPAPSDSPLDDRPAADISPVAVAVSEPPNEPSADADQNPSTLPVAVQAKPPTPPADVAASVPTCAVQVQVSDPKLHEGEGASDVSMEEAKVAAHEQACAHFVGPGQPDCSTAERASTSTSMSFANGNRSYSAKIELRWVWTASAEAQSERGTPEACRIAANAACHKVLATDCPPKHTKVTAKGGAFDGRQIGRGLFAR